MPLPLYKTIRNDCKMAFYSGSRTVYMSDGVRLSSCMFRVCRFPTLTCDKCHYGT